MATTILSLDIGTNCGWAHSSGPSGVERFEQRRGDSPGMRWLAYVAWLQRMLLTAPFEIIVYERPGFLKSRAANHVLNVMVGLTEKVAAEQRLEITFRESKEVKKWATGKGNADKAAMLAAAQQKFGPHITNDNEADALWLLDLVKRDLGGAA